jgi:hypothetical protein
VGGNHPEFALSEQMPDRAIYLNSAVEASAPRSGERQHADSTSTAEYGIKSFLP